MTNNSRHPEAGEEYLRVADVAAAFHVSPRTIARWADEGRLPHVVTLGGHRRFPKKAIEALIAQSHAAPPDAEQR